MSILRYKPLKACTNMKNQNLPKHLTSAFCRCLREEIILILKEFLGDNLSPYQTVFSKSQKQRAIFRLIGWLKGENVLLQLHKILLSYGYISCDYRTFKSHFNGADFPFKPMSWHSETVKLVYLFSRLVEEDFIPIHGYPHSLLKEHFLDRKGNILKNDSLRSSLNNVRNNPRIKIIENIINELKKVKD